MSTLTSVLDAAFSLVFLGLVARAVLRLLDDPGENHNALVPAWERHLTTAVGVPVTAVALSSMVDGPLAVGYASVPFLLAGFALLLYPNFTPRSAG